MEAWSEFTGDCPYCQSGEFAHRTKSSFEFGPRGGAGRMMRCLDCHAEFIWIAAANRFMDNEAFPKEPDGACRR